MEQFLRQLFTQMRLADLLDVAIVSALVYVLIIWLRERGSRSFRIASVGLVAVFVLARWLDLYLTTLAYQYGSIAILLTFVVVFQDDIRQGFERLTASQFLSRASASDPSDHLSGTLVDAFEELARQKIGALVVLPNREPLDRHLRGGVEVDAKVSLPLLMSIFHPKSAGHDGAVLIERERIAKLGIHLPLSKQVEKVHDSGTRHAAALGLAECCDALVVAVSEERGTITIAQKGELSIVDSPQLAEQLRTHFAGQRSGASKERLRFDWIPLLASITSAAFLWMMLAYNSDTVQRTFVIPIEYRNVPDGWEIAEPKPTFAELTLSGSEPAFIQLEPASTAVSLEVGNVEDGKQTPRWNTESNLKNIPSDLSIEQIVPRQVVVSLRRKTK